VPIPTLTAEVPVPPKISALLSLTTELAPIAVAFERSEVPSTLSALKPTNVLEDPETLPIPASKPIAVLPFPVVLLESASSPSATLSPPDVSP